MAITLQNVVFDDIEGLIRNCDYPAMRQKSTAIDYVSKFQQ